jgi:hypothetical protein
LSDGTTDVFATSVFVSGNDVYVTGYEANGINQIAKLWKNNVATDLPDGYDATGVYVFDNDVYVCGFGADGSALIWKNGEKQVLGAAARTTSILVVER